MFANNSFGNSNQFNGPSFSGGGGGTVSPTSVGSPAGQQRSGGLFNALGPIASLLGLVPGLGGFAGTLSTIANAGNAVGSLANGDIAGAASNAAQAVKGGEKDEPPAKEEPPATDPKADNKPQAETPEPTNQIAPPQDEVMRQVNDLFMRDPIGAMAWLAQNFGGQAINSTIGPPPNMNPYTAPPQTQPY